MESWRLGILNENSWRFVNLDSIYSLQCSVYRIAGVCMSIGTREKLNMFRYAKDAKKHPLVFEVYNFSPGVTYGILQFRTFGNCRWTYSFELDSLKVMASTCMVIPGIKKEWQSVGKDELDEVLSGAARRDGGASSAFTVEMVRENGPLLSCAIVTLILKLPNQFYRLHFRVRDAWCRYGYEQGCFRLFEAGDSRTGGTVEAPYAGSKGGAHTALQLT